MTRRYTPIHHISLRLSANINTSQLAYFPPVRRAGRFADAPYVSEENLVRVNDSDPAPPVHAVEAGEAMQSLTVVRSARTALRLLARAGRLLESPYSPALISPATAKCLKSYLCSHFLWGLRNNPGLSSSQR